MPTDDVTHYKPELAQELQCNKGDKAFDYLYNEMLSLPTGETLKKELLIVFAGNIATEGATEKFNAWKTKATLILDHFDSVAEKIYFKFSINAIEKGTAAVANGQPTFTKV